MNRRRKTVLAILLALAVAFEVAGEPGRALGMVGCIVAAGMLHVAEGRRA